MIQCPLCMFKRYFNGKPLEPVGLPEIIIIKTTSSGDKGIKNHKFELKEFPESDKIERQVLLELQSRAETLLILIELRLQEI